MRNFFYLAKKFIFISLCFLIGAYSFFAAAMSSQNYKIQSDSVNVGGVSENSANYKMDETIGEIGTGEASSESYKLKAGYQEMQEVYLSVSSPLDVTMSPSIGGVTGGTGNGSASWTVITDNPAGYILSIKASASPALQSGANNFADYTPAGSVPDYDWSVANADSEFGFTAEGAKLVQKFKDDGVSSCNSGSSDTADKCWYKFLTSNETISNSASSAYPSGESTTVKFRAQSGSSHLQVAGTYTATITATVLPN